MTTRAVIQARMLSTRLRGKSLMAVGSQPLLRRVIDAVRAMPFVDQIVVATSRDGADAPIEAFASSCGVRCVRGEPLDVLRRFADATADLAPTDCIVRITADNPLYDPSASILVFEAHSSSGAGYTGIHGLSHVVPEFIAVSALRLSDEQAVESFDRVHVTPYARAGRGGIRPNVLPKGFAGLRPDLDPCLAVDTPGDLERLDRLFTELEAYGAVTIDRAYRWLDDNTARQTYGVLPISSTVSLAGHQVGNGLPPFIAAEIGQNHNGDPALARRLIDMAGRCGATAVKFQKRDMGHDLTKEAYSRPYPGPNSFGETYGAHREFLELSEAQHRELRDFSLSRGIVYFCTACDEPSVDIMERIGNPIYKVASRDVTNIPLLQYIARTRKPVVLSTGMAELRDIREALDALGDGPSGIIIVQAVSQYPADLEHVNLRAMETLRREFGHPVGLSDHSAGIIAAVTAAILGACYIEKHVTLARAMKGSDQAGSLEEEGLRRTIKYIREARIACGDGRKEFNIAAAPARSKLGRSLTTRVAIAKGERISEQMLCLKSPGDGIQWRDRHLVVGKVATRAIAADQQVVASDVE
jgi:sialic acid synthase